MPRRPPDDSGESDLLFFLRRPGLTRRLRFPLVDEFPLDMTEQDDLGVALVSVRMDRDAAGQPGKRVRAIFYRMGGQRMSVFVLVSGSLWKNPEQRSSSKTGKLFVTATLRVGGDSGADFWQLTAFSESAQSELLRLGAGDALSAQGKLEIKTYTGNDGSQKIGRSIVADVVLALRQPPKERKAKAAAKPAPTSQETTTTNDPPFDDSIPF